ncbi:c-type cytochrome [Rhodophyticola porphyridii]|uniref:c-type cytochrome n=1 Tax=Rhodophyticola porphyridii TaxID=1852017 RepID=UPI0035CF7A0E
MRITMLTFAALAAAHVGTLASAPPALAQDAAAGREHFVTYCAACHGMEGRGDGRMAELLTVLPPDLTQLSVGNDGVFPTYRVARQIDGRDPLLAHGGEMPLFGSFFQEAGADVAIADATGQPIMTTQPIAELVTYLQEIQE